jgi:hypothetical protein
MPWVLCAARQEFEIGNGGSLVHQATSLQPGLAGFSSSRSSAAISATKAREFTQTPEARHFGGIELQKHTAIAEQGW